MKKVVLIDGNSLMFRAYYATAYTGNLMQARSGIYTNAIYGFVNMMNKVIDSETFDYIFVAFDKGKKTKRHQEYKEYKGTRKPMPEEFAMQIPLIKEYLDVLHIKRMETDDYEADDLIATVSEISRVNDLEVLVITGDKDLLQLVCDNVTVALTRKGISELEYYTKDNFKDIMGFEPHLMTDFKGLIGDTSDNLPGISGVGEKTAVKLLAEYNSLENIVSNKDTIKGKLGERIRSDYEVALRTKRLATLFKDANIDISLDDIKYVMPDYQKLRMFYEKVEFKSFIKRLENVTVESTVEDKKEEIIKVEVKEYFNDLDSFTSYFNNSNGIEIALEVELDKVNYHKANLLGFSIVTSDAGFYFSKEYIYSDVIKTVLENSNNSFISVDIKRVYVTFMKYGIYIKNFTFDATLASYVINPNNPSGDVKYIFQEYVECDLAYFEDIYGKKSTLQIPTDDIISNYAIKKCSYLHLVKDKMINKLAQSNELSLFNDIELPLAIVLGDIELSGFKVNKNRLDEIGLFLEDELKELEKEIYELVGHEFNISSPKQLGVILFEELKIAKGKKNKTGYSTSADVLEKLSLIHPVPKKILEYRKYSKLLSTYVTGLIDEISSFDGKIHTTFKQALTQTGRLSSVEPNIQNIPIRTEDGRLIRSAFVPSFEGGFIVSADYSQIELRILAEVSNCESMINDFNNGMDFHTVTASKIYDEKIEDVNKDMRRIAKAVNFGIVYGMSDWGLAEQLHIAPQSASMFIKKYFEAYPEIKTYLEDVVENTKKTGYTKTIFNRRRYITEINSSNYALREFAKRTSMNAPIQGSAADIIKIAMIKVAEKIKENNLESKIVAQVHDELIIDCHKDELETVKSLLKDTMEQAVKLKVKMEVDVEVGTTWDLK